MVTLSGDSGAQGVSKMGGIELFKDDSFAEEDKLALLNFIMQEFKLQQPVILKGADSAVAARFLFGQYSLRGTRIDLLYLDERALRDSASSVNGLISFVSKKGLICIESSGGAIAEEILSVEAFEAVLVTPGFSIFARSNGLRSIRSTCYQIDLFRRKLYFQKKSHVAHSLNAECPLVTVVVLTYKHQDYITQSIQSVLSQQGNFCMRVIIIDDASPDGTAQAVRTIVDGFHDDRIDIEFHANQKNAGVVANLATAIRLSAGCDYLTFCEGDDFWSSEFRIQNHIDFLGSHPESVMSFNSIELCAADGSSRKLFSEHAGLLGDTLDGLALSANNVIGNFTACFYRGALLDVVPQALFDIYTVDWFFNIYSAQFGSIAHLKMPLSVYRQHEGGEWSARKDLDKGTALLGLIAQYNSFIDYNYDEGFQSYNQRLYSWLNGNYSAEMEKFDVIIVDDVFPSRKSGFRHAEFTSYLQAFPRSLVLTTGATLHVLESASIKDVVRDYQRSYPDLGNRVMISNEQFPLTLGKVLYANFLSNAYKLLPHAEALGVPFVFTLYPGAGFALNSAEGDKKLKRIFDSPCFQKVIVTQQVIYDYIIARGLCPAEKVELIFGVVMPEVSGTQSILEKNRWGFGKKRLDICFMAHKYTTYGEDKGYDVFVNVASILCQRYEDIYFHVVGPFDKTVLDVSLFNDRIQFYGSLNPEEFDGFFQNMDIIMSPNISGKIFPGSFDGFPTASCTEAGLRGTAVFAFDEFHSSNGRFTDGQDIVLIQYDLWAIVEKVERYYADPVELKAVGERSIDTMRKLYSLDAQMSPRIEVLRQVIREPKMYPVLVELQPCVDEVSPSVESASVQGGIATPVQTTQVAWKVLRKICPEPIKKLYRSVRANYVS
ncbi:glycosyltransferase [Pseudomonas sp. S2_B07]